MAAARSAPAVRVAAASDEAALQRIDSKAWDDSSLFPSVRLRLATGPFFTAEHPPEQHVVAELDGEVVGYARLVPATPLPESQHVLAINGIAVDPRARARGVGKALLAAAYEQARDRGASKLSLRVLATNTAARALYGSVGFQIEGVLRGEFRIGDDDVDDIVMARYLVGTDQR